MTRRVIAQVAVVSMLATLPSACSRDPARAKRAHLERAGGYVQNRQYAEAVIEFRRALQEDPRDGELRFQLAEVLMHVNDYGAAMREYVRAADLLPARVDAQLKAAKLLLLSGHFEDAKTRARRVLELEAGNAGARVLLGYSLAGLKDLDAAIAELHQAILVDPGRSPSYSSLGVLQLVRGDQTAAERAFTSAVDIDPQSVDARLALTHYYWSIGRLKEAEDVLRRALALNADDQRSNRVAATFYLAAGRFSEAEPYLKSLARSSDDIGARFMLADYYLRIGRPDDAIAVLEALAPDQRSSPATRWRVAVVRHAEGKTIEAHSIIDALLIETPEDALLLMVKTRLLIAGGRMAEALDSARAAVAAAPDSAEAYYLLGIIYVGTGELENARTAFNEVLKRRPRAIEAQLQLSRVHLLQGSGYAAVRFAQDALQGAPANPRVRLAFARALMASGDLDRAQTELRQLEQTNPRWAAVHAHLGAILMKKGQADGAARYFTRALEVDSSLIEPLAGLVSLDIAAGRIGAARERIAHYAARRPMDAKLLTLAARTEALAGNNAEVERLLRRAIAADPNDLRAYAMLGQLYVEQRRLDQAKAEFLALAQRQPKPVAAQTIVAMILEAQNKTAEARALYEAIVAREPRAAVAANNLAWIYSAQGGNLDVALDLARSASERLPHQAEVSHTLGTIYLKKDLSVLAVRAFRRCVEIEPDNALYHYGLGVSYAKTGDRIRARRELQRALDLNSAFEGAHEARQLLATLTS